MRKLSALLAIVATVSLVSQTEAQFYSNRQIQRPGTGRVALKAPSSAIRVDQNLNDYLPLDLTFTDSNGKKVKLRDYFGDRPVILMPVFYECSGVCTLELNNMVNALHEFKKDSVGKEFDVITFTIRPTETVQMAKDKKDMILDIYSRKGAEKGWHFLVGDYDQIRKLTDAIGFEYDYDETTGNISHPAAAIVLTPEGQISRYFLDTDYPQQILLDSIKDAAKGRVGRKADATSFWNCIKIDPITGQRSLNILKLLNIMGVITVVVMAFAIVFMTIKHRNSAEVSADGGQGD